MNEPDIPPRNGLMVSIGLFTITIIASLWMVLTLAFEDYSPPRPEPSQATIKECKRVVVPACAEAGMCTFNYDTCEYEGLP